MARFSGSNSIGYNGKNAPILVIFLGKKVYTSVNLIFDKILRYESRSKNGNDCQNGQILWTQKAISIG